MDRCQQSAKSLTWTLGMSIVAAAGFNTESSDAEIDTKGRTVTTQDFGKIADGTSAKLFTFTNEHGVTMKVTDYGARLVAVEVPDRNGKLANVTLGFDSAEKYAAHTAFFGCTTGRFANRIAKGRFTLDGKEYKLATNGPNHLHGGKKGFDRYVWNSERVSGPSNAEGVEFSLRSPDGDEGYPGNLDVTVTYFLTDKDEVRIEYTATTDKPTVLNLTNHGYWNLAGAGSGDVLAHKLTIAADNFLAVDDGLIPTGKLTPVKGTWISLSRTRSGRASPRRKRERPIPTATTIAMCFAVRRGNWPSPPASKNPRAEARDGSL